MQQVRKLTFLHKILLQNCFHKGPESSQESSRASTAKSTLTTKSGSAKSKRSGIQNFATPISRPASSEEAWSKEDPEAGVKSSKSRKASEAKAIKKRKQQDELEAILAEELEDDKFKGTEPEGCWRRFVDGISSIWSTTDLLAGEETEDRVRTTTRELAIYIVFLVIMVRVTLSATNRTMYDYTETLKMLFEKQAEVDQVTGFWDFMEHDFLDAIYWEEWYNKGDEPEKLPCSLDRVGKKGPCPIPLRDRLIMYSNRMLGVPRMRMVRVTNQSCLVPEDFQERIKVCYGHYDRLIEDEEDFYPSTRVYTSADAWRYQSVKELDGHDVMGTLATYSGGGSIQDLREERDKTKRILRELKEGLWIKRGTRYVSVDFTLYNANINYFCVVTLHFEFPPTGGIKSTADFTTVKLLRYITKADYGLMGAEFVFALLVIYYLIEEVMEIKRHKLEYFMSFWNWLDIGVIGVSTTTISFNIYTYVAVNSLLKGLLAEPELYADFAFLASWSRVFQYASAISVFAAWIKIFKYISFNKTMSQLSGTITRV